MTKDLTLRTVTGTPLSYAEIDNNFRRLMYWSGDWIAGTSYEQYEVVLDDGWLAIANTTTSEKPAPEAIGSSSLASDLSGDAPPSFTDQTATTTGVVFFGNRYEYATDGYLRSLRYYIPDSTTDMELEIWLVTDPAGTPVITSLVDRFTIEASQQDSWQSVTLDDPIIGAGVTFDVLAVIRATASSTTFTHEWSYQIETGDPSAGEIHHQTGSDSDEIWVHQTDNDSTDRSSSLDNIQPGSKITLETGGQEWLVVAASKVGSVYRFKVYPGSQPTEVIGDVTFEYAADTSIKYVRDDSYWSAVSDVSGVFSSGDFDGISTDSHLYGIDVSHQPAFISADWDLMSNLGGGGLVGGLSGAVGLPPGGSEGTFLQKASASDYDVTWATDSTGEINFLQNQGAGVSLAGVKTGVQLPIRTLLAGTNIDIAISSSGDEVEISAADVAASLESQGAGESIVMTPDGSTLRVKSLTSSNGSITISTNEDGDEISLTTGTGVGEANTTSTPNGNGTALTMAKSGLNLPFKSLKSDGGTVVITDENDILNLEAVTVGAIPPGGAESQVLTKDSGDDYDYSWSDPETAGGSTVPAGGTTNQVLTKDSATDFDYSWQDASGGGGGTVGVGGVTVNTDQNYGDLTSTYQPVDLWNTVVWFTAQNCLVNSANGKLRFDVAGLWRVKMRLATSWVAGFGGNTGTIRIRLYNEDTSTARSYQQTKFYEEGRLMLYFEDIFDVPSGEVSDLWRVEFYSDTLLTAFVVHEGQLHCELLDAS